MTHMTQFSLFNLNILTSPLRDFVMVDPRGRFRTFKDYVCLIDDLAKCIQIHSDEMNQTTERRPSAEGSVPTP